MLSTFAFFFTESSCGLTTALASASSRCMAFFTTPGSCDDGAAFFSILPSSVRSVLVRISFTLKASTINLLDNSGRNSKSSSHSPVSRRFLIVWRGLVICRRSQRTKSSVKETCRLSMSTFAPFSEVPIDSILDSIQASENIIPAIITTAIKMTKKIRPFQRTIYSPSFLIFS